MLRIPQKAAESWDIFGLQQNKSIVPQQADEKRKKKREEEKKKKKQGESEVTPSRLEWTQRNRWHLSFYFSSCIIQLSNAWAAGRLTGQTAGDVSSCFVRPAGCSRCRDVKWNKMRLGGKTGERTRSNEDIKWGAFLPRSNSLALFGLMVVQKHYPADVQQKTTDYNVKYNYFTHWFHIQPPDRCQ